MRIGNKVRLIVCPNEHRGKYFIIREIDGDSAKIEWDNKYVPKQIITVEISNLEIVK